MDRRRIATGNPEIFRNADVSPLGIEKARPDPRIAIHDRGRVPSLIVRGFGKVLGATVPTMSDSSDLLDELRRIYRLLDDLLAARGHGAISRIQAAAGVGESYLRDLRSRLNAERVRGYDLSALLRLLRALDVDRSVFFGRVYGSTDPMALLKAEARQLGEPEEIVAGVRDLLLEEGWEPLSEVPEEIRKLDAHRHTDAEEVRAVAYGELIKVRSALAPRSWGVSLLAVYGSALRMLMRLDEAQRTLMAALHVAQCHGEPSMIAHLILRLAFVLGDRAEYRRALELSKIAEDFSVRADDRTGIGKALVDQGMWLHYLGRFHESVAINQAALSYLPTEETSNRFGALQISGLGCWALGDLETSQRYTELASKYVGRVGPWQRAQLAWLRARIAASNQNYAIAEELFTSTAEFFTPLCPISAALASTELVRIFILQGRTEDSYKLVAAMLRYVEPLRRNKLASMAMADLWRCGIDRRGLDLDLVERTIRKLEKGRAPRCARPPSG